MKPHKHRSYVEIMNEILERARKQVAEFKLIHGAGLSYPVFLKYAMFLEEKRLLIRSHEDGDVCRYQTTVKGRAFIRAYDRMEKACPGVSAQVIHR